MVGWLVLGWTGLGLALVAEELLHGGSRGRLEGMKQICGRERPFAEDILWLFAEWYCGIWSSCWFIPKCGVPRGDDAPKGEGSAKVESMESISSP